MSAAAAKAKPKPDIAPNTLNCVVLQENLARTLAIVMKAVPRRQPGMADAVRLVADEGRLRVDATDLDMRVSTWMPAKINATGEVVLPFRFLRDLTRELEPTTVAISPGDEMPIEGGRLLNAELVKIESSGATVIAHRRQEEWPAPAPAPTTTPIEVTFDEELFVAAARAALSCTASDYCRPVLTGVYLEGKDGKVTFVAADGFRLAVVEIPGVTFDAEYSALVPERVIRLAADLAKNQQEPPTMQIWPAGPGASFGPAAAARVRFTCTDVEIDGHQVGGTFPNYRQLLPEAHKTRMTVQVDALRRAVRLVTICARDGSGIVRLEMDQEKGLLVSARAEEIGSASMRLVAAVEGENNRIAFNYRYLIDTLAECSGDLVFEMSAPGSHGVFRCTGFPGATFVVMPMFVHWGDGS